MNETLTKTPKAIKGSRETRATNEMTNDQMTVGHGQAQDAYVGTSDLWDQTQETNMHDPRPGGCWVKLDQMREAHSME